jgi:hypothetical protein
MAKGLPPRKPGVNREVAPNKDGWTEQIIIIIMTDIFLNRQVSSYDNRVTL